MSILFGPGTRTLFRRGLLGLVLAGGVIALIAGAGSWCQPASWHEADRLDLNEEVHEVPIYRCPNPFVAGYYHLRQGRYESAERVLGQLRQEFPEDHMVQYYYALTQIHRADTGCSWWRRLDRHRLEEAVEALNITIALAESADPDFIIPAYEALAKAYLLMGDRVRARSEQQRADDLRRGRASSDWAAAPAGFDQDKLHKSCSD